MTAGIVLAGALSCAAKTSTYSLAQRKVAPSAYREVVIDVLITAGSTRGPLSGLSRMTRKCHVRFLGGWGPAMAPGYPT